MSQVLLAKTWEKYVETTAAIPKTLSRCSTPAAEGWRVTQEVRSKQRALSAAHNFWFNEPCPHPRGKSAPTKLVPGP